MELIKDILTYVTIFIVTVLINIFLITMMMVSGESMEPNFNNSTILIIEKISPKVNKLNRFDIVSVNLDESKNVIKRIIGLPGETIQYKDNTLYINGKVTPEPFINEDIITNNTNEIKLKDDEYFIVGDNRPNSLDSRKYGAITKDKIMGKKLLKLWQLKKGK